MILNMVGIEVVIKLNKIMIKNWKKWLLWNYHNLQSIKEQFKIILKLLLLKEKFNKLKQVGKKNKLVYILDFINHLILKKLKIDKLLLRINNQLKQEKKKVLNQEVNKKNQ